MSLKANKYTTLTTTLAASATTATLTSAAFDNGTQVPLILDYDNTSKIEVILADISGTSLTNIIRGQDGTSDIEHTGTPKICQGPSPLAELYNQTISAGWMPAFETWAYASATTITVPSGAATKYSVGDKIKLTQSTVKYFYVTAVADTVLTVTGGSDYTVDNAAITSNYYSKASSPVGFPDRFIYTATWTGYSAQPNNPIGFFIHGRKCTIFTTNENGGTSNSSNATVSLPVTANLAVGQSVFASISAQVNNSVSDESKGIIAIKQISPTVANLFRTYTDGSWTAGGTRTALFQMDYPI